MESVVSNYTGSTDRIAKVYFGLQASGVVVTQGEELEYEMGGAWGHPAARHGLGLTAASGGEKKTTSRERSLRVQSKDLGKIRHGI